MEIPIVQIGNSKGILLSKTIREQYSFYDKVELIPEKGHVVIKPIIRPKKGWEKAFKEMSEKGDDELLIVDVFEDEKFEEWK